MKYLIQLITLFFLLISNSAHSALLYEFDISDTSWASFTSTPTFGAGDSLTFEFLDGTDLSNINVTDVTSLTVALPSATYNHTFDATGNNVTTTALNSFFDWDGTTFSLTIGGAVTANEFLIWADADNERLQLGKGSATSLLARGPSRNPELFAFNGDTSHTFTGSLQTVPEPDIIMLFGAGLIGLSLSRRRILG